MLDQIPSDLLIAELVDTRRPARGEETEQIVEHMATAPFDQRILSASVELRGLTHLGRTLTPRVDALFLHLATRVLKDEQWIAGTTADQYQEDLHRAIQSPRARLAVYFRRGGYLAATMSPLEGTVPVHRQGAKPLPFVLVVYSVGQGAIVTGYQCSGLETVSIPSEARWLR